MTATITIMTSNIASTAITAIVMLFWLIPVFTSFSVGSEEKKIENNVQYKYLLCFIFVFQFVLIGLVRISSY